ncbi:MAG: hypothetical protein U0167_07380 [bacterium]
MTATVAAWYLTIVAGSVALGWLARRLRLPAAPFAIAAGLALGRTGFRVVDPERLPDLLPALLVHVALLLGALGVALGRGFLRLPLPEILRRSLRPLALAAFALLAGDALLPFLVPDLEPQRSFLRFLFPLAFTFAAFPLLAVRDLRGPPGRDAGATFLVAAGLVGASFCFAPMLLWRPHLDAKTLWKEPILVLGESGAFGVAMGVLYLLVTRRILRRGRRSAATGDAPWSFGWVEILFGSLFFAVLMELSLRYVLWPPFTALGFGAVLGRAGVPRLPVPGSDRSFAYSELPFLALMGLAFAPDLWVQSLIGPSLLHAAYLGAILLVVRARTREGRALTTGPGLLFLGLALTARLDRRMGPLMRATLDFALPAWVLLRLAWVIGANRSKLRAWGWKLRPPRKAGA